MSGKILQFGTSRFLQAHAAFFVHEAREAGEDAGPITVIQASGSGDRSGRVAAFGNPDGYPIVIRGVEGSDVIDKTVMVRSVTGGLSASTDWAEISRLFAEEAEFIVSNTGDTGYQLSADDTVISEDAAPKSFPAKLAALLCRRWKSSGKALVVLPCELVTGNGQALKKAVVESARRYDLPEDFFAWLDRDVAFADTLVDRIVSEAMEPVGAVAEPYAIWVIKNAPGVRAPCTHASIVLADDLEPYERLKLHILNLGHTWLAETWASESRDRNETVREILADAAIRTRLDEIYRDEVIPGFAAKGMEDEARAYVATTLDRFLNPFLNHRIADIAQHHAQKVERRIAAFLDWVETSGKAHDAPVLKALVARYSESGHQA